MGIWVAAGVASSVAVVTDGLPVEHDYDRVMAGACVGDPKVVPVGKGLHKCMPRLRADVIDRTYQQFSCPAPVRAAHYGQDNLPCRLALGCRAY